MFLQDKTLLQAGALQLLSFKPQEPGTRNFLIFVLSSDSGLCVDTIYCTVSKSLMALHVINAASCWCVVFNSMSENYLLLLICVIQEGNILKCDYDIKGL